MYCSFDTCKRNRTEKSHASAALRFQPVLAAVIKQLRKRLISSSSGDYTAVSEEVIQ
jgi:hypothetical protein